ncbi:hypothetical protein [Rhizobium sp. L43]|uniref:hypothetical protein n=1 Tax=Rhizobium sp. L43 TaxID=2035452 RepID=UPI0015CF6DAC
MNSTSIHLRKKRARHRGAPASFGNEGDYGKALFARDQFEAMAARLRQLKGRFILSINDVPEIRRLFDGCLVHPVELTYSIGGGKGTNANELIEG